MRIFYDEAGDTGTGGDTGNTGAGGDTGQGTVKLPDGAFMVDKFRDALPEDIRAHQSLAKITSLEELGRSYVNAQSMIGKDPTRVVEIPAADQVEEVKAVLTKLGAPADASGYKLTVADGIPEWLV